MTPPEARTRFAELTADLSRLYETRNRLSAEAQAAFNAETAAIFAGYYGKRRTYNAAKLRAEHGPEYDALFARRKGEMEAAAVAAKADEAAYKAIEAEIKSVGEVAELRPGSEWLDWESVSEHSYSSQGWGARKYARQAAEQYQLHAEFNGLEAITDERVETYDKTWGGGGTFSVATYVVRVKVAEPIDLAILKHKPAPSLKETMRHWLRKGVNPRVYMPFLPYGYEESVGLDSWGNDVTPRAGATV